MNNRVSFRWATSLAVIWWAPAAYGAPGDRTAESARFDDTVFRRGLKERGLTDLLALHLQEHPPGDAIEAVLLARDVKLAEYTDPSRGRADRFAALSEANRLLESLIEEHPDDSRVENWQMELGRSLLYTEGERFTSSLLYREGTAEDRAAVAALMERAISVLQTLHAALYQEYEALDDLAAREYDRREASGAIEQLEADLAKSDYMLAWARYYRALVRRGGDPERSGELSEVIDYLTDRSGLLKTPHEETHFQAQSLLLVGMSYRQVGDHNSARGALGQAIDVVGNIFEDAERRDLQWVATLARIELIRSLRDRGDFSAAVEALRVFAERRRRSAPDDFGMAMIAALLERTVYRAAADRAEANRMSIDASRLREKAVERLATLAARNSAYRDEIYSTLHELIGPEVGSDSLTAFEGCAYLAGLLGDAERLEQRMRDMRSVGEAPSSPQMVAVEKDRQELLERAIGMAGPMLTAQPPVAADLQPQIGFNLGVALFQRGRRMDAAQSFLRVARDHPRFSQSAQAATFAVQLAWELYRDPALGEREEVRQLYHEALTILTDAYAATESARYWQFFLGQYLTGSGRFEDAAEVFSKVEPDHERYYEARFLEVEARAAALREYATQHPDRVQQIDRLYRPAIRAAEQCADELERATQKGTAHSQPQALRELWARVNVVAGEVHAVPGAGRWKRALTTLASFEERFGDQQALMGRVLRVRMISLEALGRHEEASQLIPQYIASDPTGAAATLQGLFLALREEIDRARQAGRMEQAHEAAQSATAIAAGLYDLAGRKPGIFAPGAVYQLRLQLAEAAVTAEDFERAVALFELCVNEDAARYADGQPRDSRAMFGGARAYYGAGRFGDALPLFNQIFRVAKRGEDLWWRALLHDLKCRTALEHLPLDIVNVIKREKFLDARMGGVELRRQFDAVLAANERRADSAEWRSASEQQ